MTSQDKILDSKYAPHPKITINHKVEYTIHYKNKMLTAETKRHFYHEPT